MDHEDEILLPLNDLAERGYRLVIPGSLMILTLKAPAPEHYRYDFIASKSNPDKFFKLLNEQAEQGYRWVSFSRLTEKAPGSAKYQYRKAVHDLSGPAKSPALLSAAAEGYVPVNVLYFSPLLGAAQAELVLEREVYTTKSVSLGAFEIADAMRVGNVMRHVDDFAKQGYHYVCPHQSNKGGGLALVMAKCSPSCGGPYEYRYFDAKDPAQVERELNSLAKDGFRVLPAALRLRPHVVERDPANRQAFSYRVIEAKDPAVLEQAINTADQEGYKPVGYVGHIDWKLARDTFLILEKPI